MLPVRIFGLNDGYDILVPSEGDRFGRRQSEDLSEDLIFGDLDSLSQAL